MTATQQPDHASPQYEMLAKPLSADVFTLLRMFENCYGIDRPQSWEHLLQCYHGAYDDPSSRMSWSRQRLSRTLDVAEEAELIEYRDDWVITAKGLEARRAEALRRMGKSTEKQVWPLRGRP